MTTENRRKEDNEAKTEDSGRNPVQPLNSAMVDKAEREESILPDRRHYVHEPTIVGVVSSYNIQNAMEIVIRNKGAPGVDGITTEEIGKVMDDEWRKVKQDILDGKYIPKPVRRVEIPKPDGSGVRQLGIPTVMDRIIQQALYQELAPAFDPLFSENRKVNRHRKRPQRFLPLVLVISIFMKIAHD